VTEISAIWEAFWATDPRILQAVIGGSFLAFGWVFNSWRNRRDKRRLRAERLRDAHRAIFAEIATQLTNLDSIEALEADGQRLLARMDGPNDYIPFVAREREDKIFDSVMSEISVLPRVTIDPIVAYYSQRAAVAAMADDLRSKGYRALPKGRRIDIFVDFIEMQKHLFRIGITTNHLILVFAKEGKEAAEEEARRLSGADAPYDPAPVRVNSPMAADQSAP